jgi:DNA replication protein DnaC
VTDPTIVQLTEDEAGDKYWLEEALERGKKAMERIPVRYRDAVVDVPQVADWVRTLVEHAKNVPFASRGFARVETGPSLLLIGNTGSGKTYQAYGAIRALSVSGANCSWTVTTAADMYAQLRPRHRVDTEEEFEKFSRTTLLVLDDLGAAKGTEWNEEVNYRLINHRYENELPTLITSNVPPKNLAAVLGERVASRLVEMAERVVIQGQDRRLNAKGAA